MTDADEDLVRALHDEHAGALWAFVVSLTGDRVSAQDIVQETLLRAWRHPESLDPARGSTRAWLFTVARRLVIDDWRSARNRRESVHAEVPDREVVDESERLLQQWVLAQALTRLSPEHRAVLRECYFAGRSVAEAARVLAIPEGTVKSRTHYALMNLRLALQEMGVSR
ncbi:sigma-70 family RNA polymerase sigma factor [Kineococcus rhizosphaerae]|uniref:RNA polymerase sigma factor n=1 Tax=Kineococcus rhizosphaerae TaxID=559628 RepID=A0A2T0RA88_9ACTN|nr:sigma-70 family RNA polymerase sigma factor [Kineococcus rhizosphaerae]PRY18050.1 RNA polymerase sigma-70 factor (ECF subfamily) [Kineococcus rhizosphaerae]